MTYAIDPTQQRAIARAILTDRQYEAWDLCDRQGLSLHRASYFLNVSPSAIRDRLRTARRRIAEHVRADFPAPETEANQAPAIESIAVALLIQRDGPECYLCHTIPERYCVEHIIPRSQGGTDAAENVALACLSCNTKKGTKYVSLRLTSGRPVYHPV